MTQLPKLTESYIEDFFYHRYFDRGVDYYEQGLIFNTVQRGNILEAYCSGRASSPYRLWAELNDEGIESAACSCPVGVGCKHIAAMLLTWVHHPDKFTSSEPVEKLLSKRTKKELIALIEEMIEREPGLEMLLDLPSPDMESPGKAIDPEPLRRQLNSAFYGGDEWGSAVAVASELSSVLDRGDRFVDAGDWDNAKTIYQLVVDESLANYENVWHDEGEVVMEMDRAAEGLADCLLAYEDESVVREEILRSLFDVVSWDTGMGGYGVGENIPDILVEQASKDEQGLLREWIAEEMEKTSGLKSYSKEWRRESWGRMLLQLTEQEGDIDGFLHQARSQGLYQPLFEKLVQLDRVDEAVEVAVTHLTESDYTFLGSAKSLESAGYLKQAVQMVEERIDQIKDERLLAWLAEKREQQGDGKGALELHQRRWQQHPSLEDYKILERLGNQLGQWETLHGRLLTHLAASNRHIDVLAQIHLYRKEWDAAWEVAGREKRGYWSGSVGDEVAKATEQHRPEQAVEHYLSRAEQYIAQRGRNNYARAAHFLQQARKIRKEMGLSDVWQQTMTSLRENHRKLPALLDELNKAGL